MQLEFDQNTDKAKRLETRLDDFLDSLAYSLTKEGRKKKSAATTHRHKVDSYQKMLNHKTTGHGPLLSKHMATILVDKPVTAKAAKEDPEEATDHRLTMTACQGRWERFRTLTCPISSGSPRKKARYIETKA